MRGSEKLLHIRFDHLSCFFFVFVCCLNTNAHTNTDTLFHYETIKISHPHPTNKIKRLRMTVTTIDLGWCDGFFLVLLCYRRSSVIVNSLGYMISIFCALFSSNRIKTLTWQKKIVLDYEKEVSTQYCSFFLGSAL